MKATPTPPEGYVVVSLSPKELGKLKKMVLGYGNFKKTLDKLDMPESTFRDILIKGYGYPQTIDKIKSRLLETEAVS